MTTQSKTTQSKVVAITVTFNRIETLRKNLEALRAQTVPLYKILVVDNGSSEENRLLLRELTDVHQPEDVVWEDVVPEDSVMDVLWLEDNHGGAGGFEQGMRYAAEHYNPDWFWIMDDDAYPRPDTLEKLLEHADLADVGCLAPLIWGVDQKEYQFYHHKKTNRLYTKDSAKFSDVDSMAEVEEIDADAFVGPLFPKNVVERAGFPDGGLFIYGDDTEYTVRIGREHKIYLIKSAVIEHNDPPVSSAGFEPTTYWKLYYTIRNRMLLVKKYNRGIAKLQAVLTLTGGMLWQVAYSLVRKGLGKARFLRLKCVLKGYFDGLFGKKGKRIDPVEFGRELRTKIRTKSESQN